MCVWGWGAGYVCKCKCMSMEARGLPRMSFLGDHPSFCSDTGLLPSLELMSRQTSWPGSPRVPPVLASPAQGIQMHDIMPAFYVGSRIKLRSSCLHRKHYLP